MVYDGESEQVLRTVNVLRAWTFRGGCALSTGGRSPGARPESASRLVLSTPGDAFEAIGCLFGPSKRALSAVPAGK